MKLKVCGMRDTDNLNALVALNPDYIGFIFYDQSPRFVGEILTPETTKNLPNNIQKVGVFVNATVAEILEKVQTYGLDFVQLHGDETPEICKNLKFKGINIIKAFRVKEGFSLAQLNNFKPVCDYFLFDAPGLGYGGNGVAFDWSILTKYDNEKPFFLSGGITPTDAPLLIELKEKHGLRLHAADINSKFEDAPAQKNIAQIRSFIEQLKPQETEV